MSDKAGCPGCNGYSSSILQADIEGEPCPFCGLSYNARAEIRAVRSGMADVKLKAQVQALLLENDKLKRAHARMTGVLVSIRLALDELDEQ